jgi:signal transduction histidine kinase/DNA-binding response OmpR family regulator
MSDAPHRILLIEDNPGDARLLREMLNEVPGTPFDLEWEGDLSTGLERLATGDIDAVLVDLSLPDSKGLDTFVRVQTQSPHTPITVLTGLDDAKVAIQAVRQGAQDYLVKGRIDSNLLGRAITYAIERKRAEEEIRRRAAHLEALNAVVAAATTATDLPDLLEIAVEHTLQALNLSQGAIWRAGQYVLKGIRQMPNEVNAHEALATTLTFVGANAVRDWQDIEANPALSTVAPIIARFGIRASLTAPLLVEGRRTGGLAVVSSAPRDWPHDEVALVEAIGQQLGAAAERLRLFQAEQEQRQLVEALQEASAVVSGTLETDEVLDRILDQVERIVLGDAVNIMLLTEDGRARIARWRGYRQSQVTEQTFTEGYPASEIPNLAKMMQTGETVVVSDTMADPDWVLMEGRAWLRSYVGAPIKVGGVTVGFLNVNGARTSQFDTDDARRLQAFANHAAIAIQNAQLYRELRNYAEQLEARVQERTAQIQAQYAQLEAILRSSSDGIIVTNRQGEIIQTNPIARTWLTQALSTTDATFLRETVHSLARRAGVRPEQVLELTGMDLALSAAPIVNPGGAEAAAVVTVHDVSHLKALDRMKSRFVSNVSHELRTPITTIKLYTALMQQSPPDKWRDYLDALSQEADRQAQLVEDILQISRIDAGRLEMQPRATYLNGLMEAIFTSRKVLADERGLTMEYNPATPGPMVLVDPDRMMQVLGNLVTNAIQYTPKGGKITISTATAEEGGRLWATATVADTGMGIPEHELPHIFDRFFRGEQPRLMQVSGTGLGLAIVKEIVELQGGHVTVESKVDEGSTFTLWLPLAEQGHDEQQQATHPGGTE